VPESFLGSLNPAGLAVDQLGNRAPENVRGGPLDEACRVNHGQVLFHDQVGGRAGQWAGKVELRAPGLTDEKPGVGVLACLQIPGARFLASFVRASQQPMECLSHPTAGVLLWKSR
jgi:hypothetical protein